ncbi:MAG: histidine ammonia-lyase [Tissierellaceae bacterium]
MGDIFLDGNNLTLDEFIKVSRYKYRVRIKTEAMVNVKMSQQLVMQYVKESRIIYGITTGFGKFSDTIIDGNGAEKLQKNLIFSHACGVGSPLREEIVRGIMMLRANALAKGYSGVRPVVINTLLEMLNKKVHPIIPEKGSLGASGDLAPLAHMALVMLGEGEAIYEGQKMSGEEAMGKAGISTIDLTYKEGLALINGTQVMTSIGAFALYDAINIIKTADIAAALSMEALNGIIDVFYKELHEIRPHRGQINTARNLLSILGGSKMITRQGELRVQDAYSLRCIPQVHGASRDCFDYVKEKVEIEFNSATDNPLIFPHEGSVISGGNFHGEPMALAFDFLSIGIAELANISERRLERLVNPALSNGLPAFLTENGGVNSGFMIVQYAAASLVSENKILAHPSSVDSITSSANQEDHVSMGTIGARKAMEILDNTRKVLGMEILSACQAIDLRGNTGLGDGTKIAYEIIRSRIPKLDVDRIMYRDINTCEDIIKSNILIVTLEEKLGKSLN